MTSYSRPSCLICGDRLIPEKRFLKAACPAGASQFTRLGIERHGSWIHRRLQFLTKERILVCLDRGKAGVPGERRAALFRWVWTMKDEPTNDIDALLEGL